MGGVSLYFSLSASSLDCDFCAIVTTAAMSSVFFGSISLPNSFLKFPCTTAKTSSASDRSAICGFLIKFLNVYPLSSRSKNKTPCLFVGDDGGARSAKEPAFILASGIFGGVYSKASFFSIANGEASLAFSGLFQEKGFAPSKSPTSSPAASYFLYKLYCCSHSGSSSTGGVGAGAASSCLASIGSPLSTKRPSLSTSPRYGPSSFTTLEVDVGG